MVVYGAAEILRKISPGTFRVEKCVVLPKVIVILQHLQEASLRRLRKFCVKKNVKV